MEKLGYSITLGAKASMKAFSSMFFGLPRKHGLLTCSCKLVLVAQQKLSKVPLSF